MYTLADLPRRGAALHGPRTAVVFEGTRLTYADLNRRVNQAAHALISLGLRPGERLAVLSDNSARYLETYLAAAKLGVSVTPLNIRLGDPELVHIVKDSQAVAIVAGDGYEKRAAALLASAPAVRLGLSLDNHLDGFAGYEEVLAKAPDAEPDRERYQVSEDDLAVLMYTGGTTGLPKGVMLSHRNVMTAAIASALGLEFTKNDSTCFVLPIFHVAWWPAITLLLVGGKVVIVRKPDLGEILRLIQDEKCTHMNAVPTLYGWLIDQAPVGSYDLSSLRILTYAGSPMPVEVLKRAITVFGPIFAQGYGATETAGGIITMLDAEDHHLDGPDSHLLASAGKAGLCSEVTVVDDNDERAAPGQIGEVCVRGKHVMTGYWKNPELTANSPRGRLVPHRRPGLPRRTRLPVPHRPQVGHDHQRRRERVPHRGGERHLHPPRRRRMLRGRHAGRALGGIGPRRDRGPRRRPGQRRGDHRALPPGPGRLQVPETGDLRRGPAPDSHR